MRGAIQLSLWRSHFTNPPIRRHPLATIEAAILFRRPSLLIAPRLEIGLGSLGQVNAPGRLGRGAGLLERTGGAAALIAWMAARVEPAQPLPGLDRTRIADAPGNCADVNVAVMDQPATGAVRIWAAGEISHWRI